MHYIRFPFLSLLVYLFLLRTAQAQPYVEGGETRHRFAQMTVGTEVQYIPAGQEAAVPATLAPRLTIGGLHFWGHADLYVSIPVAAITPDDSRNTHLSTGIETGGRWYPFRLQYGSIRPYLGIGWSISSYSRSTDSGYGPVLFRHLAIPQAGLTWMSPAGLFTAGARLLPDATMHYPVSRTDVRQETLPVWSFQLGYSYPFETTLSAEALAESGREEQIETMLAARGSLDGWTAGIGISSAFTTGRTESATGFASTDLPTPPSVFPELSAGYYHHGLDAAVSLCYRPISQIQDGYGLTQQWQRHAWSLEAVKFLADYHGFVPFLGAGVQYNRLRYREYGSGVSSIDRSDGRWTTALVAGWDIRPNRLQWFTIRTVLRYTPGLRLDITPGSQASFDQFEFNFFQFVLYPERLF